MGTGRLHNRWGLGGNENRGSLMKTVKNINMDTMTLHWYDSLQGTVWGDGEGFLPMKQTSLRIFFLRNCALSVSQFYSSLERIQCMSHQDPFLNGRNSPEEGQELLTELGARLPSGLQICMHGECLQGQTPLEMDQTYINSKAPNFKRSQQQKIHQLPPSIT